MLYYRGNYVNDANNNLKKLHDTRVRVLVVLCCNPFVLADSSHNLFNYIIEMINTLNSMRMSLDHNVLDEGDLSRFCE